MMIRYILIFISVFMFLAAPLVAEQPIAVDMKDVAFSRAFPQAVEIDGRFFILDRLQRRVFVFDDRKFLFSFAQAGQGPGDLERPVGMATDGDKIYIIEGGTGKVSIFSKKGDFLQTFKLKEASQGLLFLICDLGVYDGKLAVVLTRGKEFLRIYDLNGNLLNTVSKEKEEFNELGHTYEINIDRPKERAYIMSIFNGETLIVSLKTFKIISRLEIKDPLIDKLVNPIIASDAAYKDEGFISVKEHLGFFPFMQYDDKWLIICRSKKVKKDNSFPCFTFTNGKGPVLSYIDFGVKEIRYIKKFSRYFLLLDEEGNIYLKRRI